jgi:endonuclease G, mitochondrial
MAMRRLFMLTPLIIAGMLASYACAHADDKCEPNLPWGVPELASPANLILVCHAGYAAAVDTGNLIPRWVSYSLTAQHTLGCGKRADKFHPDELLPKEARASPKDYRKAGYDRGHQAPAADFAWDAEEAYDSFSMANMAPQRGGLNRQEWERLEETVRAWAYAHGPMQIYVGPVVPDEPAHLRHTNVAIPSAFWKVVIGLDVDDALAFVMPNKNIAKGDLSPWQVTIEAVEQAAHIKLPLPEGLDVQSKPVLWPADRAAWQAAKSQYCRR